MTLAFFFTFLFLPRGQIISVGSGSISYTTIFITFHWLRWLTSTEPSFIDQVREFLLHEIIDDFNGLLETVLVRTRYMKE